VQGEDAACNPALPRVKDLIVPARRIV